MIHYPCAIRDRIRRALCHLGRTAATLYRPDLDGYGQVITTRTPIGDVAGYRYTRQAATGRITIALPGQLADEPDGEYFMVLYPDILPDVQPGDVISFGANDERRIATVRGCEAYDVYHLKDV